MELATTRGGWQEDVITVDEDEEEEFGSRSNRSIIHEKAVMVMVNKL